MSAPNGKLITKKRDKMTKSTYTLYRYTANGISVVSAIHKLDIVKFLIQYPDAVRVQLSTKLSTGQSQCDTPDSVGCPSDPDLDYV